MPEDSGSTSPRTNCTAITASSAEPPRRRTSYPASTASGCAAATMKCTRIDGKRVRCRDDEVLAGFLRTELRAGRGGNEQQRREDRPEAQDARHGLRLEHNLAEDLALLDQAERLVHLRQRQVLVDDGFELAVPDGGEGRW